MNKKILRTLTAFCAALMLMGGFSVTAFAQTPEQPAADATNDSGVIYEEPEETAPLTPEGNATLVDDFGGNKQRALGGRGKQRSADTRCLHLYGEM